MKLRSRHHNVLSTVVVAVLLMVALPLVVTGCDDAGESPLEVMDRFVDHLRDDATDRALQEVWPPTREQLETSYEELYDHFDGDPPIERHEMLVVTRVENPMVITRITPAESVPSSPADGEALTLEIEFRDDRQGETTVRYSQDDARWYVDLPLDDRRPLRVMEPSEAPESQQDR